MTERLTRLPAVLGALLAIAILAAGLVAPPPASADEIAVSNLQVRSDDPTSVTFTARVTAPAGLTEAKLIYEVRNPKEGNVGGSGTATFGPGEENDVSFTLETRSAQRYIPVGSQFIYRWEFTDEDGDTLVTEEQDYLFLDGRYSWVSKVDGDVTVYYYGNNEDDADDLLAAVRASLEGTAELLQVELPYPVRVMFWDSEDAGELARQPRGGTFDELVSTGGLRIAPDLLFVFAGVFRTTEVSRHEAAHIVTAVAGDGPFSRIPSWLDEGTAVYMQTTRPNYDGAIRQAIAGDRTLRLRNMEAPSNDPGTVNLFYGQSWSTVDFLISEFGEEQFAELYRVVREGARTDNALEQVYGFDQDGLYNLWRERNDLEPIDFAPRVDSTAPPQADATREPLGIPTGVASGGDSGSSGNGDAAAEPTATPTTDEPTDSADAADDGGGSNTTAAIVVGLVAVLLAGSLGAGALYFSRRSG